MHYGVKHGGKYTLTTWLLEGRDNEWRDKKRKDFRYSDIRNKIIIWGFIFQCGATAVAQWLRCCATNLKVAGSIPGGVIGIFH